MLFVFDWDGTLVDSAARIVECMHEAADRSDLPRLQDQTVANIIGLGLDEALFDLYPEAPAEQRLAMKGHYSTVFVARDQEQAPPLFPQALETLEALREAGHQLAVATGKSRRGLNRALSSYQLEGHFDITRCADETRSKPHPQMLWEILQHLEVQADDALMIGDTEYDMAMAEAAGVGAIAVSYGVHHTDRLEKYPLRLLVDRLEQLRTLA